MSRALATFFGVGLLPWAPGTWGSAAAIPVAWVIHGLGGFPALLAATLLVTLTGWTAVAAATSDGDDVDPREFVIDEVAGMFVALLPLSAGLWLGDEEPWVFPWPGWVTGFVLFRIFDVWKPWPVSRADRRGDALGVMLDDLIAGLLAAACVTALAWFWHGGPAI